MSKVKKAELSCKSEIQKKRNENFTSYSSKSHAISCNFASIATSLGVYANDTNGIKEDEKEIQYKPSPMLK